MQPPTDQSVSQRIGVPEQYLDIVLVPRQYKIHCYIARFLAKQ